MQRGEPVMSPFSSLFRGSWDKVIIGAFVVLSAFTMFYIVTTWVLSYGTAPHGTGLAFGYVEFLRLQLISVFFFAGTIPIAGLIVDSFGRRRTLLAVSVGILATARPSPRYSRRTTYWHSSSSE
jgi:MFS family permease